jgi:3'-5' exoribonuclease
MFPEALMLHYLDDLDSKMESMRAHFERDAGAESAWTGYNASLGRSLLNTEKFLQKKEEAKNEEIKEAIKNEDKSVTATAGASSSAADGVQPAEQASILPDQAIFDLKV